MSNFSVVVAAGLSAAAYIWLASDPAPTMPNDRLTPGSIRSANVSEICARGYAREHRVWDRKAETLAKYGVPRDASRAYEDDDRVPVCLGGDNADPANHWPQPIEEARRKDRLEAQVCRAVCAGELSITDTQLWFLGDWREHLP